MATDINGGSPFTYKQPLTHVHMNAARANDLIQLDTDGGVRAMSAKLTLNGTGVLELGDRLLYTSASHAWYQDLRGAKLSATGTTQDDVDEITSTNTTANEVVCSLLLPHDAVLTAVGFVFRTGGAHGALPATMPRIVVQSRLLSTGVVTDHSTFTDTAANVAAFDTSPRLIEASGLALNVDRDLRNYKVKFRFEGAANAVANSSIIGIKVTANISEQAKHA